MEPLERADQVPVPEKPASKAERARTVARQVQRKIIRDRVSLSAGSLAYHWFLALFPAVIAAISLLALVHVSPSTVHHLTHAANTSLPGGVASVFNSAIVSASRRTNKSELTLIVGLFVAIWSASGGIAALEQALDIAYELPRDRTYLARHLRALPLMVATVVLGGGGAALIVFGKPLGAALEGHVFVRGTAFVVLWTIVRWSATTVAVMLLVSFFYYFAPNTSELRWRWVSPGSLLATAIFLAASFGFSFYVGHFGSYANTYGSFAGVAILIFWLYLTGLAVLIGGELNAATDQHGEPGLKSP